MVARARCALSSASCRSSAGATFCWAIERARAPQSPGMSRVRRSIELYETAAFARSLHAHRHLGERLVDQEGRRDQPLAGSMSEPTELTVELGRIAVETGKIGLGIRRIFHRMIGVEKARHVEIGADVLNDHIGCVAPASDRDVAIGQRKSFERSAIGRAHDLDAGAGGMIKRGRIDRFGASEIGAKDGREPLLAGLAAVGKTRAQDRARSGVQAERGGGFRRQCQQILADRIEQGRNAGFPRWHRCASQGRRAAWKRDGRNAGRQRAERLAAR